MFGRVTQKGPSKKLAAGQMSDQYRDGFSTKGGLKRGRILKELWYLYFSLMNEYKTGVSQILPLKWFQNWSNFDKTRDFYLQKDRIISSAAEYLG